MVIGAWIDSALFSGQRRPGSGRMQAYPAVANISSRITAGQSASVTGPLGCACCQKEPHHLEIVRGTGEEKWCSAWRILVAAAQP